MQRAIDAITAVELKTAADIGNKPTIRGMGILKGTLRHTSSDTHLLTAALGGMTPVIPDNKKSLGPPAMPSKLVKLVKYILYRLLFSVTHQQESAHNNGGDTSPDRDIDPLLFVD